MPNLYPAAIYKPLGPQTQPELIKPTCVILHTMGGFLQGTDNYFRTGGYTGDEAHFGIGGLYDGADLDGIVWQWQDLDYTADAQYAGNTYGISVETSDGARSNTPWSVKQLSSIISLLLFLCRKYDLPAKLIETPMDKGIGYHSLFKQEWNRNGHDCPGAARIKQLVEYVIPQVADLLENSEDDSMPSVEDILNGLDAAAESTLAGTPVPGTKFIDGLAKRTEEFRALNETAKAKPKTAS